MKKILAAALLALGMMNAATPARATAINCTQLTGGLGLCIPKYNTDFSDWARADIAALTALNTTAISTSAAISTSTTLGGDLTGHLPNPHLGPQVVLSSNVAAGAIGAAQLAAHAVSTNTVDGVEQVTQGGTGATTAAGARSNLSAAQSGANADITSLTGGGAAVAHPNGLSASSGSFTNGVTASSGTFTATGAGQFSVVASSGISALLFKGDGSQLTNLPAASGGATVAGNNAFTGGNTHAGSESFGATVYSGTATATAVCPGGVCLVAISSWTSVSTTATSGNHIYGISLSSTSAYTIDYSIAVTANVNFGIRFNDDTGLSYTAVGDCRGITPGAVALSRAAGVDSVSYLKEVNNAVASGNILTGRIVIHRALATKRKVSFSGELSMDGQGGEYCATGGTYTGSSDITSFSLQLDGAATTGQIWVYNGLTTQTP